MGNLSSIEPELLAKAISNLHMVSLEGTQLRTRQVTAILRQVCNGSKLKNLYLSENFLGSVLCGLLARAVNRLERVWMDETYLTKQQIKTILVKSLVGTSLVFLRVGYKRGLNTKLIEHVRRKFKFCLS